MFLTPVKCRYCGFRGGKFKKIASGCLELRVVNIIVRKCEVGFPMFILGNWVLALIEIDIACSEHKSELVGRPPGMLR